MKLLGSLIAVWLLLFMATLADAQIVKVVVDWHRCENGRCAKMQALGTGCIVGKLPTGHSLVVSARHVCCDPFHETGGGGTFDKLAVHGQPAKVFRYDDQQDLVLLDVSADLGPPLVYDETEPAVGAVLFASGYDQGDKFRSWRGKLIERGKLDVAVTHGVSGGPVTHAQTKAVVGIVTSIESATRDSAPNATNFVCLRELFGFCRRAAPNSVRVRGRPAPAPPTLEPTPDPISTPPQPGRPPGERGPPGVDGRPGERGPAGATGSPGLDGNDGADGRDATDAQIATVVTAWLRTHAGELRGADGKPGTVTVVIRFKGKIVDTVGPIPTGKVVIKDLDEIFTEPVEVK